MQTHQKKLSIGLKLNLIDDLSELKNYDRQSLYILDISHKAKVQFGKISADAGDLAMKSIRLASELCMNQHADAIVTAPIHKEAISKAGYPFEGHTDFLAHLTKCHPQMLLADERTKLRVALATIHIPISSVAKKIISDGLESPITRLVKSLQTDFRITHPRLAVLGLNPHASDGGVIGSEEVQLLQPELNRIKIKYRNQFSVDGLFASDGFFGAKSYRDFDAVLAMYHDQGLIAFKILAFETGVNVTLGLPIVRTSPDHGTAFDIAGKGIANKQSFISATELAIKIASARKRLMVNKK
jgi:4-hydroxythreonine-4-phosphate dehydrogenase